MTNLFVTSKVFEDIANLKSHILIAGKTGSGKSVMLNGIINSILYKDPSMNKLVLIDPKMVELSDYAKVENCIGYADTPEAMEDTLAQCLDLIMRRFAEMKRRREKFYTGARVYIVIDEMSDLMLTSKKANYYITRIAQLGRAANVMLITATQHPKRDVIPSMIQSNIAVKIGLPVADTLAENTIGIKGLQHLRVGQAIINQDGNCTKVEFPMIPQESLNAIIDYRTR